ncbi:MAG: YibE/F family protein [Bacillota bacterium]|nr:YibE/F family protein [Bacillota bacterium]
MTLVPDKAKKRDRIFSIVLLAVLLILMLLPTGYKRQLYRNSQEVRAEIVEVYNDYLYQTGMVYQGEQSCKIRILNGSHKGEVVTGIRFMVGSIERDVIFKPGDIAFAILEQDDEGQVTFATLVDQYRLHVEALLFLIFAVLLVLFAGTTGLRTILSFALTLVALWKVLIPGLLRGWPPLLLALALGCFITITTLLLVGGFTAKSYSAIISAILSAFCTFLVAIIFTDVFKLSGTVMQESEGLLHAGYFNLNLKEIFQSAIYLSCSGAVMDLAIDISSALEEVQEHSPDITRTKLFASGLRIGRQVVGTQTSTLLLAYIGNYLATLMVFMAQGTSLSTILTSRTIAAEILSTFVGCIGIVLVSPLTSLVSAFLFTRGRHGSSQAKKVDVKKTEVVVVEQEV